MNKFLLLALMILLGVLAFSLGLFSKDDSTTLSQYVPDSVGKMFSKNSGDNSSATVSPIANQGQPKIATLTMPDYEKSKITHDNNENNNFYNISDTLLKELQQDINPIVTIQGLEKVELEITQLKSKNTNLEKKFKVLTAEYNRRSDVLIDIENQIKKLNK